MSMRQYIPLFLLVIVPIVPAKAFSLELVFSGNSDRGYYWKSTESIGDVDAVLFRILHVDSDDEVIYYYILEWKTVPAASFIEIQAPIITHPDQANFTIAVNGLKSGVKIPINIEDCRFSADKFTLKVLPYHLRERGGQHDYAKILDLGESYLLIGAFAPHDQLVDENNRDRPGRDR